MVGFLKMVGFVLLCPDVFTVFFFDFYRSVAGDDPLNSSLATARKQKRGNAIS